MINVGTWWWSLLMVWSCIIGDCLGDSMFVSAVNGSDDKSCGQLYKPCRSISYALTKTPSRMTTVYLKAESMTFHSSRIGLKKSFQLIGLGGVATIECKDSVFLDVGLMHPYTVIRLENIAFNASRQFINVGPYMASMHLSFARCTFENLDGVALNVLSLGRNFYELYIFIQNCIFRRVKSNSVRVAVQDTHLRAIHIENCTFEKNLNEDRVGGAAIFIFIESTSSSKGLPSKVFMVNNTIVDNKAKQNGGAVAFNLRTLRSLVDISLQNNIFSNNVAEGWGGAIFLDMGKVRNTISFSMKNNVFQNNLAGKCGAISFYSSAGNEADFTINNCVFKNSKGSASGTICMEEGEVNDVRLPSKYQLEKPYQTFAIINTHFCSNEVLGEWDISDIRLIARNANTQYNIIINNSSFSSSKGKPLSAVHIVSSNNNITMNTTVGDSSFRDNGGGAMTFSSSKLAKNDFFKIDIKSSEFHRNHGRLGVVAYIAEHGSASNVLDINVQDVSFLNNTNTNGSALGIIAGSEYNVSLFVLRATFLNNNSTSGGGGIACGQINGQNQNGRTMWKIFVEHSNFTGNRALVGSAIGVQVTGAHNVVRMNIHNSSLCGNVGSNNGALEIGAKGRNNTLLVDILFSSFLFNKATKVNASGAAVTLISAGNDSNSYTMNIFDSVFEGNGSPGGYAGAFAVLIVGSFNRVGITIRKTHFLDNSSKLSGSALAFLLVDKSNTVDVDIQSTVFANNSAELNGGAITFLCMLENRSFSEVRDNEWRIKISNSTFLRNKAGLHGGAVYFSIADLEKDKRNSMKVFMDSVIFKDNHALRQGGAICSQIERNSLIAIIIDKSNFLGNGAEVGGALAVNGKLCMTDSRFTLNLARLSLGGTIYARGPQRKTLVNVHIIGTGENIFNGGSYAIMNNVTMILYDNSTYKKNREKEIFLQEGYINFTSPFQISCPANQILDAMIQHPVNKSELIDYTKLIYLSIRCRSCLNGYTEQSSTFSWSLNHETSMISPKTCLPCPVGGNCTNGHILSLVNYWGKKTKNGLHFHRCPLGYCSDQPSSHDTCAPGREGILCSQCKPNFALDLFSSKCVSSAHCEGAYVLAVSTVVFPLTLAFSFVFSHKIGPLCLQGLALLAKRSFCKRLKYPLTTKTLNGMNIAPIFCCIAIFYQLQCFIEVSTPTYIPPWKEVQKITGMVFTMNILENEYYHFSLCVTNNLNFIHKKLFNIWLWTFPTLICLGLYLGVYLIQWRNHKILQPMLRRFQVCLFYVFNLAYIPFATNLFQLVHCFTMSDGTMLLYRQTDIVCYNWWQVCVLVILVVWVTPMIAAVYYLPKLLEQNKLKEFGSSFLFPPIMLWPVIQNLAKKCKRIDGYDHITDHRVLICASGNRSIEIDAEDFISRCIDPDSTSNNNEVELDEISEISTSDSISDTFQVITSSESEATGETPTGSLCSEEYRNLYELIRHYSDDRKWWPCVELSYRLSSVVVFVFIDYCVGRIVILMCGTLAYLTLLLIYKPYSNEVIYKLDLILHTFLLLFCNFSLFEGMLVLDIPRYDDDVKTLLNAFNILKMVLLLLPVPLCGVLVFVQHVQNSEEVSQHEKMK